MTKKILIIGGNGYVGSRLIHDLQNKYDMHSVDLCWFGQDLDYSIREDYKNLTKDYVAQFETIILLAGHASVKMCDGELSASWSNNVSNFIGLVKKLDKSQLLIYASTGSVYTAGNAVSTEESFIDFKPNNNYDITKYSLDMHALSFIKDGYNIVGFRFGTVNGWSPNCRDDVMINSMTRRSIEQGTISINNKNIMRPILGITDIVRAVDTVIQNPITGIYNLASFYTTVDDISSKVSGILLTTIQENPDIVGVYNYVMDVEKFRNTYNFSFNETVDTIVTELVNQFGQVVTFSNRNQFVKYE
jgi:nucleoside-diphosphate-sugar epimerase